VTPPQGAFSLFFHVSQSESIIDVKESNYAQSLVQAYNKIGWQFISVPIVWLLLVSTGNLENWYSLVIDIALFQLYKIDGYAKCLRDVKDFEVN